MTRRIRIAVALLTLALPAFAQVPVAQVVPTPPDFPRGTISG